MGVAGIARFDLLGSLESLEVIKFFGD